MSKAARPALLGVFRTPEEVAEAMDHLRALGLPGHSLKVLSGLPYPEGAFGEEPERHRLYVFPLVGALCGFAVGLLVTIGTQVAVPLVTYAMPILAIPPMINVIFQGTMLGAIIFTVIGFLFESRLPDFGSEPYDPRITAGYLGLLVRDPGTRRLSASQVLREAGAVEVMSDE